MSTTKMVIITQKNYPFYEKIQALSQKVEDIFLLSSLPKKIHPDTLIIDATIMKDKYKAKLYSLYPQNTFLSDLSINWGEKLMAIFPLLKGAMGLAVWSPKNSIEVCLKDIPKKTIEDFLLHFELTPCFVSTPGICFHYPRVISMIINEAYYVLESQISDPKSINLSMQMGASYPLGILDWGNKIGIHLVIKILNKLHQMQPDGRYIPCEQLLFQES